VWQLENDLILHYHLINSNINALIRPRKMNSWETRKKESSLVNLLCLKFKQQLICRKWQIVFRERARIAILIFIYLVGFSKERKMLYQNRTAVGVWKLKITRFAVFHTRQFDRQLSEK